jgi:hypothetical protein
MVRVGLARGRRQPARRALGFGVVLLANALVMLAPERARAQAFERGVPVQTYERIDQKRFAARPLLVEMRAGFGTIVGLLGVTVSYHPWSFLGFGAGAGVSGGGGQVGAFVQLRPITFVTHHFARLHGIGAELGYSTGPYSESIMDIDYGAPVAGYAYDRVHWLEPMLFYQTQSYRGFNLVLGTGLAFSIAKSGYHCIGTEPCPAQQRTEFTPVFTAGVGYAWDGS